MSGKKIITVFGATGLQGGAVADIFFNDPKLKNDWTVRAVTRDVSKESSKKLRAKGAEVVAADVNDKATLVAAMKGAHTVFAVTNYWEKMDAALEVQQGKNLVDAAKETGVQHFIWSALKNIKKLTNGVLSRVYHFDSKADVMEYAKEVGIPASFFMPGFYMSNFPESIIQPVPNSPDNAWVFCNPAPPTAPIPVFDTADTGKFIKAMVLHQSEVLGRAFLGATAYVTAGDVLEGFKKAFPETGKRTNYYQIPGEQYVDMLKGFGMPEHGAVELWENMRLLGEFGYYGGEGLEWSLGLMEDKPTTWEEYIQKVEKWKGLN